MIYGTVTIVLVTLELCHTTEENITYSNYTFLMFSGDPVEYNSYNIQYCWCQNLMQKFPVIWT